MPGFGYFFIFYFIGTVIVKTYKGYSIVIVSLLSCDLNTK